MSDTIKVGDRVRGASFGNGTVIGLHTAKDGGSWAWVEYDDEPDCFGSKVQNLTRIEPEPVMLRPKYKKDERVRTKGGREITVDRVFIGYESQPCLEWWEEDQLEPAPEPCPKCKGSGKASE